MGKVFILLMGVLMSVPALGQGKGGGDLSESQLAMLEQGLQVSLIASEMQRAEKEVRSYNKTIRKNARLQERMEDKADRVRYKVVRRLADVDTTVPHQMTYVEWKLRKAETAAEHAAGQVAKAEKSREEKILFLAQRREDFYAAITRMSQEAAKDHQQATFKHKKVRKHNKRIKYIRPEEPR